MLQRYLYLYSTKYNQSERKNKKKTSISIEKKTSRAIEKKKNEKLMYIQEYDENKMIVVGNFICWSKK